MTVKFTNNASSTLSSGINSSVTSLTVASASAFPQLAGADDYCYLTIQQATGTVREVVKATALSSNTFTIIRAQDNTTAQSFSAGDTVELRMTAALLTDVIDAATVEGVKTNFQYTPTAGQTVFSGADNSSNTMIINQSGLVNVYMNGVRLVQGTDYTVSAANNTITLTTGATTADIIDIEVYGNFTGQSGAAVAITGGSITGTAITATTLGASGTATLNTFVSNNATISGGTINNVAIGGTTQAAGAFALLTADGLTTDDDASGLLTLGRFSSGFAYSLVRPSTNSTGLEIRTHAGNALARFLNSGVTELYHNGSLKLSTSANGIDIDSNFRVESTSNANMLFVDAGNNRVFVGGSTNVNTSALQVTAQAAQSAIVTKVVDNAYSIFQGFDASGNLLTQITGANVLTHNGAANFNEGGANNDFRVESTGNNAMLFVDASTNRVGIGTSGPTEQLHIHRTSGTGAYIRIQDDTGGNYIGTDGGVLQFLDGSASERMRISASGYVNPKANVALTNAPDTQGLHFGWNYSNGAGESLIVFNRGAGTTGGLTFVDNSSSGTHDEIMRLEGGNLLVGSSTANDSSAVTLRQDGTAHVNNAQFSNGNGSVGGTTPSIYSPASATLAISTNSTQRVVVDGSGKVGIGGTPAEKLYVNSASGDARIGLNAPTGSDTEIKFSNNGTVEYTIGHDDATDNFVIGGANVDAELVSVDKSGNVGVGTSTPTAKKSSTTLQVNGNVALGDNNATGIVAFGDIASPNSNVAIFRGASGPYSDTNGNSLNISAYQDVVFMTGNAEIASQTERMRLDASGDLIVGGTSSGANDAVSISNTGYIQAIVNGDTVGYFNRRTSDGEIIRLQKDGTSVGVIQTKASQLSIGTGDTGIQTNQDVNAIIPHNTATNANIDNAIDLGYAAGGTNFRFKDLHLSNVMYSGSARIATTTANSGGKIQVKTFSGGVFQIFQNSSGSTIGYIGNVSDSSTLYSTSSDERLKTNIADSVDAGSKIDAIQVRQFDWKADGAHQDYGMVAQELQAVAPEAVFEPEDADDMLGVDYSKLVPMLVKEIQSLRARVAQLESN